MDGLLVDPPLRGEWKAIHNPGDHPYALDFVGLEPGRRLPYSLSSLPPHLLWKTAAANAYGWGRPVYAPFDGEVIEAQDGYPDREALNLPRDAMRTVILMRRATDDIQRFAGNYVVLESPQGVAFMAHLRSGSVRVTSGTEVTAGQRLGEVGNAGASLLPHLHFHLMSEWSHELAAIPELVIPFRFRQFDRWTGGRWESVEKRAPKSGDRLRVTGEATVHLS